MKFKLSNFQGTLKEFEIDLESLDKDALTIVHTIQSGDEVVYIFSHHDLIGEYDAVDYGYRTISCLDKLSIITLEELENLNK